MIKSKNFQSPKMWAYFSPDGYVQVRTIAETRKKSRNELTASEIFSYKDYEKEGYSLHQISVEIKVLT